MKPDFSVTSNGNDITADIADRLLKLSVKDEAGLKSDTCSIELDDRDQKLSLPATGVELEIKVGFENLVSLGKYTVDEVTVKHPPSRVSVKGKAMQDDFKTKKTRSWDDKYISEIVAQIGMEHGLNSRVASQFQGIKIEHIDQTEESDINFLTRLGKDHGAVVKPAGGMLLFVNQGEGKSASGQSLGTAEILLEECISWSATVSERGNYETVTARFNDKETGLEQTVSAGLITGNEDGLTHKIKKLYPTELEALDAAESELKSLNTGKISVNLTIIGRTDIFAERPIKLTGFRSDPVSGNFTIHSVTHELSSNGYITKIDCSNKDAS